MSVDDDADITKLLLDESVLDMLLSMGRLRFFTRLNVFCTRLNIAVGVIGLSRSSGALSRTDWDLAKGSVFKNAGLRAAGIAGNRLACRRGRGLVDCEMAGEDVTELLSDLASDEIGDTDRLGHGSSTMDGLPAKTTDTILAVSSWLLRRTGDVWEPSLAES